MWIWHTRFMPISIADDRLNMADVPSFNNSVVITRLMLESRPLYLNNLEHYIFIWRLD